MTICIAATFGDGEGTLLVSDRMVTAQFPIGYEFEHQEGTRKLDYDQAQSPQNMQEPVQIS